MFKKLFQIFLILIILASFIQCTKDDPENIIPNCVVISRSDADNDNQYRYSASGFITNGNSCNIHTLGGTFTLSSSEALAAQIADYEAAISELSHYDCSTSKGAVENLRNNATTTDIENSANAADPKCGTFGSLDGYTTYCTSQAEMDKYKANTKYYPVDSVLTDMAERLAYQQAAYTVNMGTTEFSADAISAMEPDNADTLALKRTAGFLGYSYAVYEMSGTSACRKTILDRNPDLKEMIERSVGKDADMGINGSTVTSVLASIHCEYGDDWTEPTGDSGNGNIMTKVGTCPSSYPTF